MITNISHRKCSIDYKSSAGLLLSGVVIAAGLAPAAELRAAEYAALEEVIVTAQRREENLQKVPVAVSAFSAETLLTSGTFDMESLKEITPALNIHQQLTYGVPVLRGIGTFSAQVGDESPVSTYIDGVYVSAISGSLFSLNSVERIEVLKGPQGTLFGRNAAGGVIQVITRNPEYEPSADLSVGYGNFDTAQTSFYGTVGITDKFATNLSVYYRNQDEGWGTNLFNGEDAHLSREFAIRNKWLFEPGDDTQILLSLDYGRIKNDSGHSGRVIPGSLLLDGSGYPGFYNVNTDFNPFSTSVQKGAALKIDHSFGWAKLASITSWRKSTDTAPVDGDFSPSPLLNVELPSHTSTWTQELQLLSPKDSALSWVVGAYYLHDVSAYDKSRVAGALVPFLFGPFAVASETFSEQTSYSLAGFGQATVEIFSATRLTGGLRYTSDHRAWKTNAVLDLVPPFPPLPLGSADDSATFNKATYKLALDHNFTSDVMGYVQYSRGFKSGVYNLLGQLTDPPVRPETLDSYEAGLKSEWFDRRLRLNASAFFYDVEDIQVQKVDGAFQVLVNAAKAEVKGVEAELEAVLFEHFTIRGGAAYLDAKFEEFQDAPVFVPGPFGFGNIPVAEDLSGVSMPFSPKWTANVGIQYEIPTAHGTYDLASAASYNDGYIGGLGDRLREPSYTIVNASVGWTSPDQAWTARAWARNLFDVEYLAALGATSSADSATPGAPRTFGFSISRHWE